MNTGQISPTMFDCVDPSVAGIGIEVYYYEGQIVLPGNAPDWTFAYSTCCRNPAIDNLISPASRGLYISASLNNMYGQNDSPTFVSEPVRSFCINRKFNWKQGTIENDGDSLFYKLVQPKDGEADTCNSFGVPFDSAFSYLQPISTGANDPLVLDPHTGIISFTPTNIEVDVMSIAVEEWRFSTTINSWYKIGETNRDMQFVIASTCNSVAQAGIAIDTSAQYVTYDTTYHKPRIDVYCWSDTALAMTFDFKLDCSTVSSDASEFGIYLPNGSPLVLDSAFFSCDVNNEAFDLSLFTDTILGNGKYVVYLKNGTDGDVITNKCGFGPSPGDTLCIVNVQVPIVGPILGLSNGIIPGYTYPYTTIFPSLDSTFWSVNGGSILQGQGTDTVFVQWNQVNTGGINAYRSNDYGCLDSSALQVVTALGIEENSTKCSIYPNPNKGVFTLDFNGSRIEQLTIYNFGGAKIFERQEQFTAPMDFQFSQLTPGIYFIFATSSDNEIYRSSIIIQ
jgi:hypothetical protein